MFCHITRLNCSFLLEMWIFYQVICDKVTGCKSECAIKLPVMHMVMRLPVVNVMFSVKLPAENEDALLSRIPDVLLNYLLGI